MNTVATQTAVTGETSPDGKPPRAPSLVVAFHCDRPLEKPSRHSLRDVHAVEIGRGQPHSERVHAGGECTLRIAIPDPRMSTRHARMSRAVGRWVLEDLGSRNGTRVDGERIERQPLDAGNVLELGHTFFLFQDGALPAADGGAKEGLPGMATLNPDLREGLDKLEKLAPSGVSVLLQGPSGCGKELLAQAMHRLSRTRGEFVPVNCGAIPETLVESELFGHARGAFSGAVADKLGLIRSAAGGTLFLDEIGDLASNSQAKLLRVLQERAVRPVGGTRSIPIQLRLVSATHQDLEGKMGREEFREDLYARIAGFSISLPPLCQRMEDMGIIIADLLRHLRPEEAGELRFTTEAVRALFTYSWPHNIRELENCLRTATILAGDAAIGLSHLPDRVQGKKAALGGVEDPRARLAPEQLEHCQEVEALLREHRGNVSAVARAVGKDRRQVQRWIHRYSIDVDHFR